MTSIYQPLDQGIIAAFKAAYKSKMLAKLLNSIDNYDELAAMADRAPSGCRGLRFGQKANVLDAALIVREAWDELEAESIAACWSHSGCLPLIQHCDVTASRNGYRKQVESSAIADMAKLLEKIDLTNDGSRKAIRELGLDEVTTVMSSDDKHQVIQRWLSLENDPEVIAFEDIDPPEIADQRESSTSSASIESSETAPFESPFFDFNDHATSFSDSVSNEHSLKSEARSATLNFLNAFDTTSDKNDLKSAFFKMNDIFLKYMMSSE